jgi:four helix bundle protein
MQDFRNLKVWEKAHQLTLKAYGLTRLFPKEETYGLTSQIKRASSSIPINISEGCGRRTNPEIAQFFQIAMGSASEFEYELLLAKDLGYLDPAVYSSIKQDVEEVKKMLAALISRVRI